MRMRIYTKVWLPLCAAAVLALAGCLGGGIDTGADRPAYAVVGRVTTPSGAPVPNASVKLFPSNYDPTLPGGWSAPIAVTDSNGFFFFVESSSLFANNAARAAHYSVIACTPDKLLWSYADSLKPRYTGKVDTLKLSAPRRLVVSLHPDTTFATGVPGEAFVPGTDIVLSLDGTGPRAVDSVPAEAARLVLRASSGWSKVVNLSPRDPLADTYLRDTLRVYGAPTGSRIGQ